MTPPLLTPRRRPRLPPGVVLVHGTAAEMLEALPELLGTRPEADLVVSDPPWDAYDNNNPGGRVRPDLVYPVLDPDSIRADHNAAARHLRPGGRMAIWTTCPMEADGTVARAMPDPRLARWVSGGAWIKVDAAGDPAVGVGYHWRGAAELVRLYVRGTGSGRPSAMVLNAATGPVEGHSRKPVAWIETWVRAWVPPGGLVLDLYAGTGAVGEAVVRAGEGRRYVGAELDADRHAGAVARMHLAIHRRRTGSLL